MDANECASMGFDFREEGQLTVAELIVLLQQMPPDALVWHEGCDCFGAADRVEIDKEGGTVLIGRCN